jgi:UDP-galactopyranose mutase
MGKMGMKNVLVIGCGISGAALARRLADSGKAARILVVDRRNHVGGNCHDYPDGNIFVHKYGAHIFHTNSEQVWQFVRRFAAFNTYMHHVTGMVDGKIVPIPFSLETLHMLLPETLAPRFEEKLLSRFQYGEKIPIIELKNSDNTDLSFLSDFIYRKIFLEYTKKQWGIEPDSLDPAVLARVPVFISRDTRYFQDKYQGMPVSGFTQMIKTMLDHPKIEIALNTSVTNIEENFDMIFATCQIDEYFGYKYGILPYRSLRFEFERYDAEFYQENSVINYPDNYDFTRVIEFKRFYPYIKTQYTVIAKEYPQAFEPGINEPFYPVQNKESALLYEKYLVEAGKAGIRFLGRLGDFKYYDMDAAVKRALDVANEV